MIIPEHSESLAVGMVNHSGIPMFAHDGKGLMGLFNAAAEEWSGWSWDEVEIMGFHGLLVPDSRQAYEELCGRVMCGEAVRVVTQLRVVSRQAGTCTMDVELYGQEVGGRRWIYGIGWPSGVARRDVDLHAELVRERELSARLSSVAEVASGVLHNVGNVINSVNVSSTLIEDELRHPVADKVAKLAALLREHGDRLPEFLSEDPRGRGIASYVAAVAEHLGRQQERLRAEVAALRRGVEHIKEVIAMQQSYSSVAGTRELIGLDALIEDALRMNEAAFERHGVRVVREYGGVPRVNVDRHRVLQILVNLFRNAKYALDEGEGPEKQMRVRLSETPCGGVEVAVIDNGVGMDEVTLGRVFERGFTTRKDGHGFGLNSGRRAAREMGGTLTAESAGRGRGATFLLRLPADVREGAQGVTEEVPVRRTV